MNNLIGVIVSIVYILMVFAGSKLVAKKGEEVSRKFIHILLCNIWIFYYLFINNLYVACILPAIFVVINSLSYKFKILKTMEREKNDGFGTVYYAVSILIVSIFTYLVKNPLIGFSGIFIMGYGDGFAAIFGKKIKSKEYSVFGTIKSIAGSITMFIISLMIMFVVLSIAGSNYIILKSLGIAALATCLEAVSVKGFDNITVPVVITVLTYFCI